MLGHGDGGGAAGGREGVTARTLDGRGNENRDPRAVGCLGNTRLMTGVLPWGRRLRLFSLSAWCCLGGLFPSMPARTRSRVIESDEDGLPIGPSGSVRHGPVLIGQVMDDRCRGDRGGAATGARVHRNPVRASRLRGAGAKSAILGAISLTERVDGAQMLTDAHSLRPG